MKDILSSVKATKGQIAGLLLRDMFTKGWFFDRWYEKVIIFASTMFSLYSLIKFLFDLIF